MSKKVGEIIKDLINTDNYIELRMKTSDEFVNFIKTMMPSDYEYFREREEAFQELNALLQDA